MAVQNGTQLLAHEGIASPRPELKLPSRLRLLCVGGHEPSWTSLTLQLDAEGCLEPSFRWVSSSGEALYYLRNENFDCVLITDDSSDTGDGGIGLLQAIRASGCDDPVVLIMRRADDRRWTEVCLRDCELLVTPNLWESLALVPVIKRAISRIDLIREYHRLSVANHRRLLRERDEAEHLLGQQRQIVQELETLARSTLGRPELPEKLDSPPSISEPSADEQPAGKLPLPAELNEYYHELLRTYVIMGSGNLGGEIARLAELLALAGFSPREALEVHLERVESLVRGLGNRSTRHVMARADLLVLELMIHLGEHYQRTFLAQGLPRSAA